MTVVLGQPRYELINRDARDRPYDVYASSKLFGEHVGRFFAFREREGRPPMQVLCLRLGQPCPAFNHFEKTWREQPSVRALAVDGRDIARAIECALVTDVRYGVYPIVSGSDSPYIDPALYAELGYAPGWKFTVDGLLPAADTEDFTPAAAS